MCFFYILIISLIHLFIYSETFGRYNIRQDSDVRDVVPRGSGAHAGRWRCGTSGVAERREEADDTELGL